VFDIKKNHVLKFVAFLDNRLLQTKYFEFEKPIKILGQYAVALKNSEFQKFIKILMRNKLSLDYFKHLQASIIN
jgi:hypothetical protein